MWHHIVRGKSLYPMRRFIIFFSNENICRDIRTLYMITIHFQYFWVHDKCTPSLLLSIWFLPNKQVDFTFHHNSRERERTSKTLRDETRISLHHSLTVMADRIGRLCWWDRRDRHTLSLRPSLQYWRLNFRSPSLYWQTQQTCRGGVAGRECKRLGLALGCHV